MGWSLRRAGPGADAPLQIVNAETRKLAADPDDPTRPLEVAAVVPEPVAAPEDPRVTALMEQLSRVEAERQAEAQARATAERTARAEAITAAARQFADAQVTANKVLPAGKDHLATLYAHAHLSKAGLPAEGIDPAAALTGFLEGLPPHGLTQRTLVNGALPGGRTALPNGEGAEGKMTPARRRELLSQTPTGRAALAAEDRRKGAAAH